jgi:hypothetical protein
VTDEPGIKQHAQKCGIRICGLIGVGMRNRAFFLENFRIFLQNTGFFLNLNCAHFSCLCHAIISDVHMNPSRRDWLQASPNTDNSVPIQDRIFSRQPPPARIIFCTIRSSEHQVWPTNYKQVRAYASFLKINSNSLAPATSSDRFFVIWIDSSGPTIALNIGWYLHSEY